MSTNTDYLDALRQLCILYCGDADNVIKLLEEGERKRLDEGSLAIAIGYYIDLFSKDGLNERWETNTNLTTYDLQSFEKEIRNNILDKNYEDKLIYFRIVNYEISEFVDKSKTYNQWCNYPKPGESFKVDRCLEILESEYLKSRLVGFIARLKILNILLERVQRITDKYKSIIVIQEVDTHPQPQPAEPGAKLQWKSNPTITGYIISELIRAGYLEPPITNGELSYAKLAGICNQIFDIRSDGKPTTLDYLKKVVNPESNQLPDHKRAKLRLPDLDQLT